MSSSDSGGYNPSSSQRGAVEPATGCGGPPSAEGFDVRGGKRGDNVKKRVGERSCAEQLVP
jgi:hypothetical protein